MKKAAILMPAAAGLLWGTTGVFVRILSAAGFDNMTIIMTRTVIASAVLFLFLMLKNKELLKIRLRDLGYFIGCGITGMLLLNICYNVAIRSLTLSFAAVLLSTSPVFVVIVSAVLFKEKITGRIIVCMLTAFFGCVLVSGLFENLSSLKVSAMGIALGLASAVFNACYSTCSKAALQKGYETYTIIFYNVILTSIILLPFAKIGMIGAYITEAPLWHMVILLANSLAGSVLPYILFTEAFKYVGTSKVSIIAAGAEPSAAMVFGMIAFQEIPTALNILGLAVTIAALAFLCLDKKQ